MPKRTSPKPRAEAGAAVTAAAPVHRDPSVHATLPIGVIEVRSNVRRTFDPDALQQLADSIASEGVIEPLIVRLDPRLDPGTWLHTRLEVVQKGTSVILVAGERRLRAAGMAGLREVPVIIRDLDEAAAARLQLMENLERVDLDPIEEAHAFEALVSEHHIPAKELAAQLGVSEPYVSNRRRLLRLPEEIRANVSARKLAPATAEALIGLADVAEPALIRKVAAAIEQQGIPSSRARAAVVDQLQWTANWRKIVDGCRGDHSACPCRVVVNGQALCQRQQRFDEVEEAGRQELRRRGTEHIKALRADPTLKPDKDLISGVLYVTDDIAHTYCDPKKGCPCRRVIDGSAYCIEPSRMRKIDKDPYAERRAQEAREREQDATAVADLVQTVDLDDPEILRWLIAASLARASWGWIQPDTLAKELYARAGQKPPKIKDLGGSQLHTSEGATMNALAGRGARQLKADLLWVWVRSTPPQQRGLLAGEKPQQAPATADDFSCDLCCDVRHKLVLFVNDRDPGAPVGAWIRVCADDCGVPDPGPTWAPDEGPDMDAHAALRALGWRQVDEVPEGAVRLDDEADDKVFLANRVQATAVSERFCRICGCSDSVTPEACDDAGGCEWVEADLCSTCHEKMAAAPAGGDDA